MSSFARSSSSVCKKEVYVRLRVLRGVGLAPQDFYGPLMKPSSDPYCVVIINGVEIGRTSTRQGTLDPVWADAASSFRFETALSSRVRVVIRDWDICKDDDPMGEVSFVVGDIEKERRTQKSYNPNKWLNVVPTDDSPSLGKIEVGIMLEDGCPAPGGDVGCGRNAKKLSRGPNVVDRPLRALIAEARTPVILHIYDVGHSQTIRVINRATEVLLGGVFHSGVEIYGREYSFGGSKVDQSGIFACLPTRCPMHTYLESVYLGDCYLPKAAVKAILHALVPKWRGNTYDILRKNCCSFSTEFAIELGVGPLPDWTDRLAKCGASLQDTFQGRPTATATGMGEDHDPRSASKNNADGRYNDLGSLLLDHIMAVRLQSAFRARKARDRVEDAAFQRGVPSPRRMFGKAHGRASEDLLDFDSC